MSKIDEAREVLAKIGMPADQQGDICCLSLLALAGLGPQDGWLAATRCWLRIHDIIEFISLNYGVSYAENSRETFRKQAMHPFRAAALIEDNNVATNSPNYMYRLTPETLILLSSIGSEHEAAALAEFSCNHEKLTDVYSSRKKMTLLPVQINGIDFSLSTGGHNELQKAVIEDFAPCYAPDTECLYLGDTADRDLVNNAGKLSSLGFQITVHGKLPDIILYNETKDWLYFIEAVTSVGPIDPRRLAEINGLTSNVKSGKIFVTAFADFDLCKRYLSSLAWETYVWIASAPEHVIHLNGDQPLCPR